ncbi:pyruvate kinase [Inmirania thermothiophila]|uniref:Pyruvate kinase n=1 Tax=Inmirania thermothiophila TaxID=1750597 RepID=A0A3N1Y5Y0_9GAMM|nr:pyruvate kinase [Inmirania thermothiophila]ROR34160.1 pyruvate kinase [Inmirania thermothiophila]
MRERPRRTKIVATLGPATDDPAVLDALIRAGIDVARVNFSHGDAASHRRRARLLRERAEACGREVGLLMDLQGPKIRIERFRNGPVHLREGAAFAIDPDCPPDAGDETCVGITYKDLPRDVGPGDILLLDDGAIVLEVERVRGRRIETRVVVGGELSDAKGINRRGGGLSARALTDKDRADIRVAAELEADYLAVSFPRGGEDVAEAKALFREAGGSGGIVAKIERAEAVRAVDEILEVADAIMVARGDLGVEMGDAELPGIQKWLIGAARNRNRVVITATQMMQSMVTHPMPTRAEVFDVANAVLDATDAVMLSAETAVGRYPVKAVEAMHRICLGAERQRAAQVSGHRMDWTFRRIDEAIAMATMYTANHLPVRAIAALTESGDTPLWMSRIRSGIPIYALSRHRATRRRVTLYRGVYPVEFDVCSSDHARVNLDAVEVLRRLGAVEDGDLVILTKGDLMGVHGGTNAMKIVRVGDMPVPEEN